MEQHSIKRFNARMIAVIALAFAVTAGFGLAYRSTAAAHDPAEHVREALLQSAAGFERADMTILNKVWANDESLTVFESGHANYGWADYRDHHLVPEMKEMKNTKYTLSDIKISMTGPVTAWATFKYAISGDVENRHVDGGGLGTAVLEKRGQQWQIVHWHSSAPRRAPAATPIPVKKN